MIRVALCTDGVYPQAMGGMQRHSRLLAEHLARSGQVELTVLHPHDADIFDKSLGIHEVHVPDIDRNRFYFRELWRYSDRIGQGLEKLRPDVVLSQGFCVWKGVERFSDRLIVHPHGLEMFQMLARKERLLGWPFRAALKYILRRSAVVISLGGKLTGILQGVVAGSTCRVVVLPNATEVPELAPSSTQSATSKPIILLFVGRFAFNKGLDVLMAVARRLIKEGKGELVRFQLAGDGPLLAQYQQTGLPANVELLGRVDDLRLEELYRDCDALILPTRFEGMPTVVLEAMARAKPIIVSDVGASGELVSPHNGYLLPPGDAAQLYNAVLAFASRTPEVRARMGAFSYERVQEVFSWPVVVKGFEKLFLELARDA